MRWTLFFFLGVLCSTVAHGRAISMQALALAPNAGGQQSYSLRYYTEPYEFSLFSTQYLITDGQPLSGVTASYRFNICKKTCWAQAFIQPGAGFTQIGPHMELTWGFVLGWTVRIDLTTQMYVNSERLLTWSYPLWAGISVPF